MQKTHPELVVFGATAATDAEGIKTFRDATGGAFPVITGMSEDELIAWETRGWSDGRIIKDGKVASRNVMEIEKHLAK